MRSVRLRTTPEIFDPDAVEIEVAMTYTAVVAKLSSREPLRGTDLHGPDLHDGGADLHG